MSSKELISFSIIGNFGRNKGSALYSIILARKAKHYKGKRKNVSKLKKKLTRISKQPRIS